MAFLNLPCRGADSGKILLHFSSIIFSPLRNTLWLGGTANRGLRFFCPAHGFGQHLVIFTRSTKQPPMLLCGSWRVSICHPHRLVAPLASPFVGLGGQSMRRFVIHEIITPMTRFPPLHIVNLLGSAFPPGSSAALVEVHRFDSRSVSQNPDPASVSFGRGLPPKPIVLIQRQSARPPPGST